MQLEAAAKAKAIRDVNLAVEDTFKSNAQIFKALEVTESSLKDNMKVVLTEKGISPSIIFDARDDARGPVVVKGNKPNEREQ